MNIKKILRRAPTPEEIRETLLEQALDEAAAKTRLRDAHKAIADTYGEFRDIAKRYPNLGDQMTDVSDRFRGASKVLSGDWQWMLQDARYRNNPLVAQAISEIIERDGLKGLKPNTVSELQRRLDVRTDLKNEKAIKQNRLQKQLDEYEDLDDIVAKKFAHKEDTDVTAELMGMNPSAGEAMPDRLKQAMEAIALNRGVPVVNEVDDVLNNPFVEEAIKNKRFATYENKKIPSLRNRVPESKIGNPDKSNPKWESRSQAISKGDVIPGDETAEIERLTREAINTDWDAEYRKLNNQLKSDLFEVRNPHDRDRIERAYKKKFSELGQKRNRPDYLTERYNARIENQDLGDSDIESIMDQFKDARQLEWENPTPRYETENALREAEFYKDPVKPTLEQRQRELIQQTLKTDPERKVPYTKYSREGFTMNKSNINELDALMSMYPRTPKGMSEAEKIAAGGVKRSEDSVSQARINMDVRADRLPKEVADRFGDKLKQMSLRQYNDFLDEMFGKRYPSNYR